LAQFQYNLGAISIQSKSKSMQHVLIIHEVTNYTTWKTVFDNAADIRKEAGERSYQVLKYENEPNRIVHFSQWTSIEAAKQFFESPKLVQIRKEAGVKAPDFIYLEQLESGIL
jgi:quinol monooxygenase YgiN